MVGFFSLANKKKADLRHCKKVLSVQNTRLQVILNTQSLGTFSFKTRIVKIHFFFKQGIIRNKKCRLFYKATVINALLEFRRTILTNKIPLLISTPTTCSNRFLSRVFRASLTVKT